MKAYTLVSLLLFIQSLAACTDGGNTTKKPSPEAHRHEHPHDHGEHEHGDHDHADHAEDDFTVELDGRQFQTSGVELGKPSERSLSGSLSVNGYIDTPPYNLVTVSAIMGGVIRSTNIIEGTKVKKGQVLATIENPVFIEMQQSYLDLKSRLEYAGLELQRQQELQKEQINARKSYESARSEHGSLQARMAGLEQQLASIGLSPEKVETGIQRILPVYSPISGTVTSVFINLGKHVSPTDPIFEIVNSDHLHVELRVFESDIHKVKTGQSVRFSVVNDPGRVMEAEVHLINARIDEDRTVRIHCHFDKTYRDLLPGQYVKASIETGSELSTAVPDEAVVTFENKHYIFRYNGKIHSDDHTDKDVFRMTEISKGKTADGYTAIRMANPEDTLGQIAVKGAYTLLSVLKNNESDHGHAH